MSIGDDLLLLDICLDVFQLRIVQVAKEFVAVVGPLTLHKHSRVRIAAIQTLTKLIHCGAHEMILELLAFQNPNVIPLKVQRLHPHLQTASLLCRSSSSFVLIEIF